MGGLSRGRGGCCLRMFHLKCPQTDSKFHVIFYQIDLLASQANEPTTVLTERYS